MIFWNASSTSLIGLVPPTCANPAGITDLVLTTQTPTSVSLSSFFSMQILIEQLLSSPTLSLELRNHIHSTLLAAVLRDKIAVVEVFQGIKHLLLILHTSFVLNPIH
jgi:hypothetical protein